MTRADNGAWWALGAVAGLALAGNLHRLSGLPAAIHAEIKRARGSVDPFRDDDPHAPMKRQIIAHLRRNSYVDMAGVRGDLEYFAQGGGKLPTTHPDFTDYSFDDRQRYPGWTDEDFKEVVQNLPPPPPPRPSRSRRRSRR